MARAKLSISRSALQNNYRVLAEKVPGLKLLPMVKANAYGHHSIYTAKSLLDEKMLQGFGVSTFSEGFELRLGIGKSELPILVFSDCAPWEESRFELCENFKLEPVFSEISSLLAFQAHPRAEKIKAHIEVNSGMNRMGISPVQFREVKISPASVFTHLADAENPNSKLTKLQIKTFHDIVLETKVRFPNALLHFSNSSAIWNARYFPLTREMDFVRPGLSLYGVRPFEKARDQKLKRVMRLTAPILNRYFLKRGDQVGYGGTYTCKKPRGEWVATLAIGYADGLFRSLSSKGIAVHEKNKFKLVGRVSMDLAAVEANAKLKIGDELELWGDSVDPYVQANFASTIPYEIITRMGQRLERIYE